MTWWIQLWQTVTRQDGNLLGRRAVLALAVLAIQAALTAPASAQQLDDPQEPERPRNATRSVPQASSPRSSPRSRATAERVVYKWGVSYCMVQRPAETDRVRYGCYDSQEEADDAANDVARYRDVRRIRVERVACR